MVRSLKAQDSCGKPSDDLCVCAGDYTAIRSCTETRVPLLELLAGGDAAISRLMQMLRPGESFCIYSET